MEKRIKQTPNGEKKREKTHKTEKYMEFELLKQKKRVILCNQFMQFHRIQ